MGAVCCIKKNISDNDLNDFNVLLNYSIKPITGTFSSKILKIEFNSDDIENINVTFIFKHDNVFKQLTYDIKNSIEDIKLFKDHYTKFIDKLCLLDLSNPTTPKIMYCGEYLNNYLKLIN